MLTTILMVEQSLGGLGFNVGKVGEGDEEDEDGEDEEKVKDNEHLLDSWRPRDEQFSLWLLGNLVVGLG